MPDSTESFGERLTGGVVNDVWRVGDTVRRPTGPWTPAVHALLRHLESVGFPYSPRVLGIDDLGREVLTYIDGAPGLRPWPPVLRTDDGLRAIGRMLRELAEAVQSFTPPPGAVWRTTVAGPPLPGGSIRHGDLGMWNTIWDAERLVGLIDWDFAEPAPPLWDLAQAAWYAVPFFRGEAGWRACGFAEEPDLRHRFTILCDAYGADPAAVLDALSALQSAERQRVATLGAAGIAPFTDFLARGDLDELDTEAAWLAAHRQSLA
ncbi:aminoglycoside phosphotransferase family protein [Actinopolymorpha alba]|uniref:aminoglycoside phosphotransferase family protein n=1 Tax=Actinopolymorpha alba TaxID=533267 RepID=UPI0003654A85|nr:aminoglycoside phosphotransferase family protein [Actinopolymorpha alba]